MSYNPRSQDSTTPIAVGVTTTLASWGTTVRITATANMVITLPPVAGNFGLKIELERIDANPAFIVTVQPNGTDTYESGSLSFALAAGGDNATVRAIATGVVAIIESPNPAASASTGVPDWVAGGTPYALGTKVIDLALGDSVTFRSLTVHVSAATPPSEDPVNWLGSDVFMIGSQILMGHRRDAGQNKAMRPSRTLSRVKFVRLANALAPIKKSIATTLGSNVLRLQAGDDADVDIGDVVDIPGIPLGATVYSLGSSGSKIGSLLASASSVFWRPGVLATGFQPVYPSEVTGTGLGAAATALSSTADVTATFNTVNGSASVWAAPGVVAVNNDLPGCYVTGGGIPTDTRLTAIDKNVASSANAGVVNASPSLFAGPDLYSQVNSALLVGRRISSGGYAGNPTVTAITDPEAPLTGNWSWSSSIQSLCSPWDVLPADTARAVVNRRFSFDALAANFEVWITSFNPTANRAGAVLPGVPSFFWQTGQAALPGSTIERRIGNVSGAIPALTYVSGQLVEAIGVAIGALAGSPYVFFSTGATALGVVGQFVTSVGAAFSQARITNVVAEYVANNVGVVAASTAINVQPGSTSVTTAIVGQKITGANVPASAIITAYSPDLPFAKSTYALGSTSLNLPVGVAPAPWSIARKVVSAGLAANTSVVAGPAEIVNTNVGLQNGSSTLWLSVGVATAPFTLGRYVSHPSLPTDARILTINAQSTQASVSTNTGSPNVYWPGGVAVPATIQPGMFITAPGIAAPARVASVSSTSLTSGTWNNVGTVVSLVLGAPLAVVGCGISGAGIPANTKIISVAPQAVLGSVTTTNGSTTVNSSGLFTASMLNQYISGPGIPANARIVAVAAPNQVTLSFAAGIGFGTGSATLGEQVTISAATTSLQANAATTLSGFVVTDTNSISTSTGVATLGAWVDTSAVATATVAAGINTTLGGVVTLSVAASATGTDTNGTLGALLTSSLAATGTNAAISLTLGRVLTLDANATVTNGATTAVLGAVSTLNANATASDATAATFGMQIIGSNSAPTTNRSLIAAKVGAILNLSSNGIGSSNSQSITFGPIATLSLPATATGSPSLTIGGFTTLDAADATTVNDQVVSFGSAMTITANATVTADSVAGRFWPYGAGNGVTTFGIGVDLAGRVIGVAGTPSFGNGASAHTVGSTVGEERHLLTGQESGIQAQTINPTGYTDGFGVGGSAGGNSSVNLASTVSSQTTWSIKTTLAQNISDKNANQDHNVVQPTSYTSKMLHIYAGAV